jgi:hypothetical protein
MNRDYVRRLRCPDAEEILSDLTTRQFVRPHASVNEALSASAAALGFCTHAAERALLWLEVAPSTSVGRLTRTQLAQLARCLFRFCRQTSTANAASVAVDAS